MRMRRIDNPEQTQNRDSPKEGSAGAGSGKTITISRRAWVTLALLSSTLLTVFFSETMLLPAIPEIIQDFNITYGTGSMDIQCIPNRCCCNDTSCRQAF